jgi:hypothetical protein
VNEDWSLILDVCDRVGASPSGPAQAVSSLIKRLAHRNANVQLYALELANALSQNCGPELHRELASKAFTDALLRLAADRNTHGQVKQKVLERMGSWSEQFKGSHELGIMDQAYHRLRQTQPGLMPPSKPGKSAISSEDRRKEDDELQMALALSVQDSSKSNATPAQANGTVGDDSESQPAQAIPGAQATAAGTTAATVSRVRALYDFTPSEPGELAFKKNDIIAVLESVYKDWWKGSLRGQTGIFPLNYVEKLQDATKEELERDAQMESEVFGEVRSVEKLLALLSVEGGSGRRGEREEDEIADLYQRTLSIRPKLVELIGKYSQKKGMLGCRNVDYDFILTFAQTTSLSSTRSSSKRDAIMRLCSNPRCLSHNTTTSNNIPCATTNHHTNYPNNISNSLMAANCRQLATHPRAHLKALLKAHLRAISLTAHQTFPNSRIRSATSPLDHLSNQPSKDSEANILSNQLHPADLLLSTSFLEASKISNNFPSPQLSVENPHLNKLLRSRTPRLHPPAAFKAKSAQTASTH